MRFFKYFFVYLMITIFAVVCMGCVYYIFNGADLSTNTETTMGVIRNPSQPTIVSELSRGVFAEEYTVSTMQAVTVEYVYGGISYKGDKEVHFDQQKYKSEPVTSTMAARMKYTDGMPITIYVYKDDPTVFDMDDVYSAFNVEFKTILTFGVPLYAILMIGYTWMIIQKEKELKRERFIENYKKMRY